MKKEPSTQSLEKVDNLFRQIYEDRAQKILSNERFQKLSLEYETEQAEIATQIEALKTRIEANVVKDGTVSVIGTTYLSKY